MKKWLIPTTVALVLILAVTLLIVLPRVLGDKDPAALAEIKAQIEKNGVTDEELKEKILVLSADTYIYEDENGTVVLYRIEDDKADGNVVSVSIVLDRASVKNGVYSWEGAKSHTNVESHRYTAKGKIVAKELTEENGEVGFTFVYYGDSEDLLEREYARIDITDACVGALHDLAEYLKSSSAEYGIADLGFEKLS